MSFGRENSKIYAIIPRFSGEECAYRLGGEFHLLGL